MNAIENVHEVRFPIIYILSHTIYYILPLTIIVTSAIKAVGFSYIPPLTIIVALAVKAVGFPKVRQTFSNIFVMRYGDIKDQIWI